MKTLDEMIATAEANLKEATAIAWRPTFRRVAEVCRVPLEKLEAAISSGEALGEEISEAQAERVDEILGDYGTRLGIEAALAPFVALVAQLRALQPPPPLVVEAPASPSTTEGPGGGPTR